MADLKRIRVTVSATREQEVFQFVSPENSRLRWTEFLRSEGFENINVTAEEVDQDGTER